MIKKYAIVDIGSNTVKMTVFDADKKIIAKDVRTVGLISYVKNGILLEKGIEQLKAVLSDYIALASTLGCEKIHPFATASLRAAKNKDEIVKEIKNDLGVEIDIVDGDEEAELSLDGVFFDKKSQDEEGLLFDMGGGSCEVTFFEKGSKKPTFSSSLPFGALTLFSSFVSSVIPSKEEAEKIFTYVTSAICKTADRLFISKNCQALSVGGSIRATALILSKLQGRSFTENDPYEITLEELESLSSKLISGDKDTILLLISHIPQRIHTVTTAIIAYTALLKYFSLDKITVVSGGAREGYFLKILKSESKAASYSKDENTNF